MDCDLIPSPIFGIASRAVKTSTELATSIVCLFQLVQKAAAVCCSLLLLLRLEEARVTDILSTVTCRRFDKVHRRVPYLVYNFAIVQSVEYAITAHENKIEIGLDFEATDLWIANDHIWVASKSLPLCFDITKSPRNREPSWEDSQRPLYINIFL